MSLFSLSARLSHPAHGLIPNADVNALTKSPTPVIRVSLENVFIVLDPGPVTVPPSPCGYVPGSSIGRESWGSTGILHGPLLSSASSKQKDPPLQLYFSPNIMNAGPVHEPYSVPASQQ